MQLNDIRGEQALIALGEIMEPLASMMDDKKVQKLAESGNNLKLISYALKKHYHEVFLIMAALHGEDPKTYSPNILQLPKDLMDLLNDPEMNALFFSQSQNTDGTSSGNVTEITKASSEKTEK